MDKISDLKQVVINTLDLNKAQDIVTIDLKDKSSMADYMIIASGTSSRHIPVSYTHLTLPTTIAV